MLGSEGDDECNCVNGVPMPLSDNAMDIRSCTWAPPGSVEAIISGGGADGQNISDALRAIGDIAYQCEEVAAARGCTTMNDAEAERARVMAVAQWDLKVASIDELIRSAAKEADAEEDQLMSDARCQILSRTIFPASLLGHVSGFDSWSCPHLRSDVLTRTMTAWCTSTAPPDYMTTVLSEETDPLGGAGRHQGEGCCPGPDLEPTLTTAADHNVTV